MRRHKIEYCTHTANPITGCPHGCSYCYARRMAHRWSFREGTVYHRVKEAVGDPFAPSLHLDKLRDLERKLLGARRPRDIFLGSMSDIGADTGWNVFRRDLDRIVLAESNVSGAWVQKIISEFIQHCYRHTFYLLTKNPSGMIPSWPRNARVGVSVENNKTAEKRIPEFFMHVRAGQVGLRWISLEPLLDESFDALRYLPGFNWVVMGAQTGSGVEPFLPRYESSALFVKAWCYDRGVPLFVKDNIRKLTPEKKWPMQIPPGCALNS